jgi:hypothetical protein
MQHQLVGEPVVDGVLFNWSERDLVLKRHPSFVVHELVLLEVLGAGRQYRLSWLLIIVSGFRHSIHFYVFRLNKL